MLKKMIMTACFGLALASNAQAAGGLETVKSENELTFAMSGAYPPFNFVDEQGDLAGFDVEIGREIAKRIGVEGEPIATAWDGIIAGLLANRYDTIIGSMAITDERLKTIDFSNPYYRSGAQHFVKKGAESTSLAELKGAKIGVTLGTTFEGWLRENAPDVEVRTYKGVPQMMMETQSGRLSGFVTDRLTGLMAIQERDMPIQMAGDLLYPELIGIAMQKDNPELLSAINKALADMQADGTYQQISEKWFGTDIR